MDQNELEALVAQVPDEILDYIEELETRVEKAEAAAELQKSDDAPETDGPSLEGMDPAVAEFIKSQTDRLAKAEKALEDERLEKADNAWIAKARTFDGIIDDPEDFGRKLRAIAESDEELADAIATALTTASAQVTKGDLFSELGHGTPVAGSAEEKIATIAKALVEADPSKSKEAAEAEAWEANPALYEQHVADRQAALRGGN